MPKRTNEFQQLVYLIQKQLASDAKVTESELLIDRQTGSPVEVDIVVSTTVGHVPIHIGFECTAGRRPATVEWVREMACKHAELPIDKTVLVSKSGFSAEAARKASAAGIETISFADALSVDWSKFTEALQTATAFAFRFQLLGASVEYSFNAENIEKPAIDSGSDVVEVGTGNSVPLRSFLESFLKNNQIMNRVMESWIKTPDGNRRDCFELLRQTPPLVPASVRDASGEYLRIKRLNLKIKAEVCTAPISLNPVQFLDTRMVYGVTRNILNKNKPHEKIVFSFFDHGGEVGDGAALLPSSFTRDRVCPLRTLPPGDDGHNGPI